MECRCEDLSVDMPTMLGATLWQRVEDECVIMVEAELCDETMAEALFGRTSNA